MHRVWTVGESRVNSYRLARWALRNGKDRGSVYSAALVPEPLRIRAVIRFDDYVLDVRSGELHKSGRKIKLQEQPFQILEMLPYGFRPGRGCHGALEHIRLAMGPRVKAEDGCRQRTPYQWVIKGDINGCWSSKTYMTVRDSYRQSGPECLTSWRNSRKHCRKRAPHPCVMVPRLEQVVDSVRESRHCRFWNRKCLDFQ